LQNFDSSMKPDKCERWKKIAGITKEKFMDYLEENGVSYGNRRKSSKMLTNA